MVPNHSSKDRCKFGPVLPVSASWQTLLTGIQLQNELTKCSMSDLVTCSEGVASYCNEKASFPAEYLCHIHLPVVW